MAPLTTSGGFEVNGVWYVWVMPQSALASWSVEQGGLAIVKIQLFGVLYRHDSTYSYMANTTFKCLASSYTLFNLH